MKFKRFIRLLLTLTGSLLPLCFSYVSGEPNQPRLNLEKQQLNLGSSPYHSHFHPISSLTKKKNTPNNVQFV